MYYDINVSLDGRHFFATSDRSVTTVHDLKRVLPVIQKKFPESEGFKVSVSHKTLTGRELSGDALATLLEGRG